MTKTIDTQIAYSNENGRRYSWAVTTGVDTTGSFDMETVTLTNQTLGSRKMMAGEFRHELRLGVYTA